MNYRRNMHDCCYENRNNQSFGYQENYEQNDFTTNSWNYYPDNSTFSNSNLDNRFEYDQDTSKGFDNNTKTQCYERNCHSFRPCFTFPCFKRPQYNDCRCRKERDCHYERPTCDNELNNNSHCPTNNTRLYFSGCIEFKNTKKW